MTGFEVYKMYLALKQHFTKPDYDYFKYREGIPINTSWNTLSLILRLILKDI